MSNDFSNDNNKKGILSSISSVNSSHQVAGPSFLGADSKPAPKPSYSSPLNMSTELSLESLEKSLIKEMRSNMDAVKRSAEKIKERSGYTVITSIGTGPTEVVIFNISVVKELPYTSKSGKSGSQKVNFFGVMSERGTMAIRVSSALRSKFEDALKFSVSQKDDSLGLVGKGDTARVVLKLPTEEYGSANVLHVPVVGDVTKGPQPAFTGLDAVEVDASFVGELMDLTKNEVSTAVDFEASRKADLLELQQRKDSEIKKAALITEKLQSFSL